MAKRKKKQSAMGIFFSFFLKAVVIILGLVILAMSAFLVKELISMKNNETEAKADDSAFEDDQEDDLLTNASDGDAVLFETDEETTEAAETTDTAALPKDASIVVLNATETAGLAAVWKETLEVQGYTNVQVGNYTNGILDTSKIVVVEEGTGSALQQILPNAKMETLPADQVSCDISTEGVQAFLIIGNADNSLGQ
ncbi:MAG: LytR C-terminal domain-containing protein [Eubacterium sp.]|nr:LytR C-terminal domain-containing protein [Eubacterium sp.]